MTQKRFLPLLILAISALLIGCSSNPVSKQTRTDLTAEHVRGLYADMDRNDVEDLLGKSDSALAEKESFEMYSLADGTYAVLRYAGDKLQAAYIRGKDNVEEAIFNNYQGAPSTTINDGTTNDNNSTNNGTTNNNNTTNNGTTNNANTTTNGTTNETTHGTSNATTNGTNNTTTNGTINNSTTGGTGTATDHNNTLNGNTTTNNNTTIHSESETTAR